MNLETIQKANELVSKLAVLLDTEVTTLSAMQQVLEDYGNYLRTEIERLRDAG